MKRADRMIDAIVDHYNISFEKERPKQKIHDDKNIQDMEINFIFELDSYEKWLIRLKNIHRCTKNHALTEEPKM